MKTIEHVVTEAEQNKRIDKLLTELETEQSRSQIQSQIEQALVTVNGKKIKSNYKCQLNDEIIWQIPEEEKLDLVEENIPLHIVYEDEDVLVVNKPKNMVVYPTLTHKQGTLVNALLYHCEQLSDIQEGRPGIIHRLDKDTSGLLLVAKNNQAHVSLAEQLNRREIKRVYEAVVHEVIEHDTGLIDAPIGRDPYQRTMMNVIEGGKDARTHFRVLQRFNHYTHVECQLETGRTHQIRVHMKYIGHPLVGDTKYGAPKTTERDGQALFAKTIGFQHPITNEWLEFSIEQPKYFQQLLVKMEKLS